MHTLERLPSAHMNMHSHFAAAESHNSQLSTIAVAHAQIGTESEVANCVYCRPELLDEDDLQLANESSDSEPFAQFADLDQSSSNDEEVMAPYGVLNA